MIRRALLAFSLLASLAAPAFAQAPPPVPALPDSERRTTYTITATTCACAVGFQIYGDNNDVDNWIQVWVNGARKLSTDATFGWSLSSATGPLLTIPRPITDAVVTFNSAQTATVQIVGAERPRRLVTFSESQGVTARSTNQAFNTLFAEQREFWDKINDVTGRALLSQPGNTIGPLPSPSACINGFLAFDASGLNPICQPSPFSVPVGSLTLPGSTKTGDVVTWGNTTGTLLNDSGNGVFNVRLSYGAVPDGSTNNATAIAAAFTASNAYTNGSPTVYFDCGSSATTCVYNYGGSGTSPINPLIPTSIVCAPGVTLNYTGTAHAADIGPGGSAPSTAQGFVRYLIQGCRWTGGASYTGGIVFANWTLETAVIGNVFNNFGNQTGYNIVYAGPNNWDALVSQSFWYDTDGFSRNILDAHLAISTLRFTDNSVECTAIGSPCSVATIGVGLWVTAGTIAGNILQYHQPMIRMSSCTAGSCNGIKVIGNHFESNSSTTGPAISYGDPGTVGANISSVNIFNSNFFFWPTASNVPTIGPESASSGSHQLSGSVFNSNIFAQAPSGGADYINTNGGGRSATNWNTTSAGVPLSYASSPALVDRSAVNDFALYNFGGGAPGTGQPVAAYNSTGDGLQGGAFHNVSVSLLCVNTGGTGTAQNCSVFPGFSGPVTGDIIVYMTNTANTGSMTLNVNSSSAVTVKKANGTANLVAGDIPANMPEWLLFDGTNWELH